jgi:hypothetical protein
MPQNITIGYKRACIGLLDGIQCASIHNLASLKYASLGIDQLKSAFEPIPDLEQLFNSGGAMTAILAVLCLCFFIRLPYTLLSSIWWAKYVIIIGLNLMLIPAFWAIILFYLVLPKVRAIFPASVAGLVEMHVIIGATCTTVAWLLSIAGLAINIDDIDTHIDRED